MQRKATHINDELLIHYKECYNTTQLKTFSAWKAEGKTIKKGEKAFKIWSKPRNAKGETAAEAQNKDCSFDRWYIANLFDISQVN